jgi:hypothetical protein
LILVTEYWWYHLPVEAGDCEHMVAGQSECLGHHEGREERGEEETEFCEACGTALPLEEQLEQEVKEPCVA